MNYPWTGKAKPIPAGAYERAAKTLGCDVEALKAVWEVEAAGQYFQSDGTVLRRFEPHHMPGAKTSWRDSLNISTAAREKQFLEAYATNANAALRASSWGAPQIMGFNCEAAGFSTPLAMVTAMAESAEHHLTAFVTLITDWGIDAALRAHDWLAFARRYNGSGQPQVYAQRMEAAYRRHSGLKSAVVLRVGSRGEAVRKLQQALGITVDGVFGPSTLEAVKAFQRAQSLPVDGIVGYRTWSALEVIARIHERTLTPETQDSVADVITRESGRLVGVASAVGAAATALQGAVEDLPEPVVWAMIAGMMIGGAIWLWKRRRGIA